MADNTVRAETPDPTKYHENYNGIPGTMLPRSARGGESLAFDPNKPQMVIVDPGEAGGGFQLDISELAKQSGRFNSAANRAAVLEDPAAFYKELSQESQEKSQIKKQLTAKLQEKMKEPIVPEPLKPIDALPSIGQSNPQPAPQPQPLQAFLPEPGPTPAPVDPQIRQQDEQRMEQLYRQSDVSGALDQLLQEEKLKAATEAAHNPELAHIRQSVEQQGTAINSIVGAVNSLIESMRKPAAPPTPPSTPTPEAEPAAEASDPDEAHQKEVEANIAGFADLKIPFLSGAKPSKPEYDVYFEMGDKGTMAARFHAVVPGKSCLALVYDTRFEHGFQYLPPNLGEQEIEVSVPKLDGAVFNCSSLGLHWSLGCLDVVIMIKHDQEKGATQQ